LIRVLVFESDNFEDCDITIMTSDTWRHGQLHQSTRRRHFPTDPYWTQNPYIA